MCEPLTIAAIAGVAAVGTQVYSSIEQSNAQEKMMNSQKQAAEQQAKQQQEMLNSTAKRAKTPNISEMLYGPKKGDLGSTSLTGPSGVDMSKLSLGKSSLLGS